MRKVLKWGGRIFLGALALLVLALGVAYYLASGSLPDYEAEVEVAGLSGPVEIVRDAHAVPHISGETDEDVYFGLGYVHAQDRLWQMTMLRRTAQGRLSELFGEATFETDVLLRALDIYGVAREMVGNQSAETQAAMRAYAAGVNARLEQVREDALGRGAPEFFLFSSGIAPWTPADSVAVNRIMALQLSGHATYEVRRAELSLLLDEERLRDLLPEAPRLAGLSGPDFAELFPGLDPVPAPLPERHAFDPVAPYGMAGASNAWAADPDRSASDATLLANDPHLGLSAPSIWMLARLEFPGGGAIGGTIPGLPGIIAGRNADFAWGLTTAYTDDQDIYIEELDPEDPSRYRTPDGWAEIETRDVLIGVGDAPARTVTLGRTRHGPILPGDAFGADRITPPGHVAALAWTALDPTDRSMDTLMGMARARSIEEGRAALDGMIAPSQNFTMADRQRIALHVGGRAPLRQPGHQGQGRMPSPGWVAGNDWQGYVDPDEMPQDYDPRSGILINTNNRTTSRAYPYHLSHVWGDTQRIQRARRLLTEREFHTADSFVEAQVDTISQTARILLPLIGRDLWWTGSPVDDDALAPLRRTALERLADWNGEMSEHGPEPLIYAAWVRHLQRHLVRDELGGAMADRMTRLEPLFIERVFRDIDGAAEWCDIRTSDATETCSDMARRALDDALAELRDAQGSRVEAWNWGEAHLAMQEHQVLRQVPGLSFLASIIQPTGGGDNTLMRGRLAGDGDNPYANVHASGLRFVVDFGDPENSRYIISTGQSGHLLSRHYDDLSVLWRRGEYIPMTLDMGRVRAEAIGTTRLLPGE
ncbi:penicillin acylase family protein [Roseobacter sp. HKCCA0434]|uniref:penicillin acylase family protein n=1 Tax=Roseobacter sp. HKCCA0434 TaxID=3079297 RepID=UPI0029058CCE|nr:penicillin acylase family protein [Roseobacter sp. HKCCA0434]